MQKVLGAQAEITFETLVEEELIPEEFGLMQNYPNPFNPSTVIGWQLPVSSNVTLKVFDILGSEVITLVNSKLSAGYHKAEFNGRGLSGGVYIYQIRAIPVDGFSKMFISTKKFTFMK